MELASHHPEVPSERVILCQPERDSEMVTLVPSWRMSLSALWCSGELLTVTEGSITMASARALKWLVEANMSSSERRKRTAAAMATARADLRRVTLRGDVPVDDEESGQLGNAVDGVGVGEGQVVAGVGHGGGEAQGAFVVEDGEAEAVEAVVGVAKVVVEVGGCEARGEDLLVELGGLLIVGNAVGTVGELGALEGFLGREGSLEY